MIGSQSSGGFRGTLTGPDAVPCRDVLGCCHVISLVKINKIKMLQAEI